MYIEQLYTSCLAEAAYYIESNGEAAIIDPLRESSPYIELARQRKAEIRYIFETHFHADFVSGHIDLSRLTGAPIIYGPIMPQTARYLTLAIFPLKHCILPAIHQNLLVTCYLMRRTIPMPCLQGTPCLSGTSGDLIYSMV